MSKITTGASPGAYQCIVSFNTNQYIIALYSQFSGVKVEGQHKTLCPDWQKWPR
jgi:hypothetical protein